MSDALVPLFDAQNTVRKYRSLGATLATHIDGSPKIRPRHPDLTRKASSWIDRLDVERINDKEASNVGEHMELTKYS